MPVLEDQPGDAERRGGREQAGQGAEQRDQRGLQGDEQQQEAEREDTPMTSGVEASSWALRSRFSTAAPPTNAEAAGPRGAGRRCRRAPGSDGSTVGTAWISA